MVYDTTLASRVRSALADYAPAVEKAMFGGLAFMVADHMACGTFGDELMVRVGADLHDEALARGARTMGFPGRPMRGMVLIAAEALTDDETLDTWVEWAVQVAEASPPKKPKKPRRAGQ